MEGRLEGRLLIAYGLIGTMTVGGAIWYVVARARRRARKLRLRGIKTAPQRTTTVRPSAR